MNTKSLYLSVCLSHRNTSVSQEMKLVLFICILGCFDKDGKIKILHTDNFHLNSFIKFIERNALCCKVFY
jgi:hypothetical protein